MQKYIIIRIFYVGQFLRFFVKISKNENQPVCIIRRMDSDITFTISLSMRNEISNANPNAISSPPKTCLVTRLDMCENQIIRWHMLFSSVISMINHDCGNRSVFPEMKHHYTLRFSQMFLQV